MKALTMIPQDLANPPLYILPTLLWLNPAWCADTAGKQKVLPVAGEMFTVEQLEEQLAGHNPVDRLAPLAKAKIPIFHIHGDLEKLVPLDANSATVASRYKELGGSMTLQIATGQGHNYWRGFFECQDLADFERFERHLSETKYDVIHFNFGLNDIYRGRNGRWHNPPEQYAEHLDKIATLLKTNQ